MKCPFKAELADVFGFLLSSQNNNQLVDMLSHGEDVFLSAGQEIFSQSSRVKHRYS